MLIFQHGGGLIPEVLALLSGKMLAAEKNP